MRDLLSCACCVWLCVSECDCVHTGPATRVFPLEGGGLRCSAALTELILSNFCVFSKCCVAAFCSPAPASASCHSLRPTPCCGVRATLMAMRAKHLRSVSMLASVGVVPSVTHHPKQQHRKTHIVDGDGRSQPVFCRCVREGGNSSASGDVSHISNCIRQLPSLMLTICPDPPDPSNCRQLVVGRHGPSRRRRHLRCATTD